MERKIKDLLEQGNQQSAGGNQQRAKHGRWETKEIKDLAWRGLIRHAYSKLNMQIRRNCDGQVAKPTPGITISHVLRRHSIYDKKHNTRSLWVLKI